MAEDTQKKLQELIKMRDDGITTDKEIYAEQRSNVLLVSGDHYTKKNWRWLQHVRENSAIDNDQKIRLTRNHMSRVQSVYVNKIVSMAPGTTIEPQNEKELKDQKAAELHSAVWKGIKHRHKIAEKVQKWANSYVCIGELFVKISWDWEKGEFKRQETVQSDDGLQPQTKDLWTGDLEYEEIFGFDLFRPKESRSFDQAEWIGYQKMVNVDLLKERYKDDESKLKSIEPDGKMTFLVFDESGYKDSKNTVLISEVYYKPCYQYPKGYFYFYTTNGILEEGELPAGLFPIKWALFHELPTHPRGRSRFKQLKPYQIELNRVGSKMAEHQITLGDDKLVMTHGGKMSAGGQLNGVRAISVTGQNPIVIPGRTGEQYLGYANSIVAELYQVAEMPEETDTSAPAQVDPYALLLSSSRWKTRFSMQIQKFERFLVEVTELSLDLYKNFVEEDTLVYDIGKGEQINIVEFKAQTKLCYQINVEPQADDMETRVGKKMSIDRYIQYSSGNLAKEDLGKFLRLDPYLNKEQIFNDFTTDYDNSVNDILAMDRGQIPLINAYKYKDPNYPLKKFASRMSQTDFSQQPPAIQNLYQQVMGQYQMIIEKQIQDTAKINSEFIPTGGALVRCDLWVPDPKNPERQVRASFPYESLIHLKKLMENQGMTQEALMQQGNGVISSIADRMRSQQPQQPQMSPEAQQLSQMINQGPRQG